ncbi:MAG: crossover junction endodeoxyribonuclease RuvC [Candidatus Aminicenantia bacterium]
MGIDPSLNSTGYCIIEKEGDELNLLGKGIIETNSKALEKKLYFLSKNIKEVIENYLPDTVALEYVFNSPFKKTSINLALATGAIISAIGEKGKPLSCYTTTEVKKAITGWGRAGKEEVEKMVKRIVNIDEDIKDDVSDAIAVALCHMFSSKKIKELR